jgi:hypothetical protein
MEATRFSEMSGSIRTARHYGPEGRTLHSHRHEYLTSKTDNYNVFRFPALLLCWTSSLNPRQVKITVLAGTGCKTGRTASNNRPFIYQRF